jgi:hypothetical protein
MRALRLSIPILAVLGLIAGFSVRAEAQQAKPDYEAARRHYQAAEKAAAAADWSTAAKEYGVAYDITRDAVLFFKLGNAYQQTGDCTRAVEYYKRYLAEANPGEEFQKDTNKRIETCKKAPAAGAKKTEPAAPEDASEAKSPAPDASGDQAEQQGTSDLPAAPEPGQPSFVDTEPSWQRTAAWTSTGLALAFATAGAVLGLSAKSREEDVDNLLNYRDPNGEPVEFDESTQRRYEDLIDEGERLDKLSMVAFGVAGAATASAVIFFILDPDSRVNPEEEVSHLVPTVTPEQIGVSAKWSF